MLAGHKVVPMIALFVFVMGFELSSGPIVWLYNAEILKDKALGLALFMIYVIKLITSTAVPLAAQALGDKKLGWIFIFCGTITGISVVFFYCCVKETMGKSQKECHELYL